MRKGYCKHFNGTQDERCKAGIDFHELVGNAHGWGQRLPCNPLECDDKAFCDRFEEPTYEEILEYGTQIDAVVDRMQKVDPLIRRIKSENKGKDIQVIESCPECAGKLHIKHISSNGHTRGCCETENCLSWME